MTVEEMLTVGVEIATGTMTTENMTETIISHVAMTREAGAVRGPGLGKDRGIMIAAGNVDLEKTHLIVYCKSFRHI